MGGCRFRASAVTSCATEVGGMDGIKWIDCYGESAKEASVHLLGSGNRSFIEWVTRDWNSPSIH